MFIVLFMLLELNGFAAKTIAIVGAPNESLKFLTKIGYSIRNYLGIKSLISLLTGVLIWINTCKGKDVGIYHSTA
jgi:predicted PurR-regulated permease PerM